MSSTTNGENGDEEEVEYTKPVGTKVTPEDKERLEEKAHELSEPGDIHTKASVLRKLIEEQLDRL